MYIYIYIHIQVTYIPWFDTGKQMNSMSPGIGRMDGGPMPGGRGNIIGGKPALGPNGRPGAPTRQSERVKSNQQMCNSKMRLACFLGNLEGNASKQLVAFMLRKAVRVPLPGGICPGGMCPGGMCPGGMWPGGICPGGMWPGGMNGGGICPGGNWPSGIWPGGPVWPGGPSPGIGAAPPGGGFITGGAPGGRGKPSAEGSRAVGTKAVAVGPSSPPPPS